VPETQYHDEMAFLIDAINDAVGAKNPLANRRVAELRRHSPGKRMWSNRLDLINKLLAEAFGGLRIVSGDEGDDSLQIPERGP
jgi:hypothetical protein